MSKKSRIYIMMYLLVLGVIFGTSNCASMKTGGRVKCNKVIFKTEKHEKLGWLLVIDMLFRGDPKLFFNENQIEFIIGVFNEKLVEGNEYTPDPAEKTLSNLNGKKIVCKLNTVTIDSYPTEAFIGTASVNPELLSNKYIAKLPLIYRKYRSDQSKLYIYCPALFLEKVEYTKGTFLEVAVH